MPNWSSRLFFFGMVAYLVYVVMIGDAPKWYALLTSKATPGANATTQTPASTAVNPAQATGAAPLVPQSQVITPANIQDTTIYGI